MPGEDLPDSVKLLFWDVEADTVDLESHADYVMERVMSRGSWEAMKWLRARYARESLADFLRRRGERLTPRDRAYWALVAGEPAPLEPGGGRPTWAG